LIDISLLQKYDVKEMYKVYDLWPQIARQQFESNLEPINFENVSHMVFAGMGGSGSINDIFSSIFSTTKIHIDIVKGYHFPKTVVPESVVIVTSVSGNTAESLSVLKSATNLGCKIIAFSSGGKMEKFCAKNDVTHIKIPFKHSPRSSFTSFLFSMLRVLEPVLPINSNEINESIIKLEHLQEQISYSNLNQNNPALTLAEWITNIPIIYYPWGLRAAAIRFKNSLQENCKTHASSENVIEACHNGIESWEKFSFVKPILIQGADDYPRTKERWKIIKEYLKKVNVEFFDIHSENGNILTKLICLIYLCDYATIYKAVISEIDPSPVDAINFIKSKL